MSAVAKTGGTTSVHYLCQHCKLPVRLPQVDPNEQETVTRLTTAVTALPSTVTSSASPADAASATTTAAGVNTAGATTNAQEPLLGKKTVRSKVEEENVVSEDMATLASGSTTTVRQRNKTLNRLFDLLSQSTDIDHPLCEECVTGLFDKLTSRVNETNLETAKLEKFLESLQENPATPVDLKAFEEEAKKLELEEEILIRDTEELLVQRKKLESEEEQLRHDEIVLDDVVERYWREYNEFQAKLQVYSEDRDSVEMRYRLAQTQLAQLKKTNVLNDAFHISYEGHFGVINGYKLGRLPTHPVEWTEINAAWGMAALLLQTLANKLKIRFKKYKLVPLGSFSRLEKIDDQASGKVQQLELYGSGGFRFYWHARFDQAMIAFLDLLRQLKEHIESLDQHFKLPCPIEKDLVGDMSIKMQFNNEENWTKALKRMLVNLKWSLAFVVSLNH